MTQLRRGRIEDLHLRGLSERTQEMEVRLAASGWRMTTRPLTASRRTNAVPTSALARTSRTTPGVPGPSPDAASSCSPPTTWPRAWTPLTFVRPPREQTLPGIRSPTAVRTILACVQRPRSRVCLATLSAGRAAPARRDVSAGAILTRLACASTSAWATGPRTATCPCPAASWSGDAKTGAPPRPLHSISPAPGRGGTGMAPATSPRPRSRVQATFQAALRERGLPTRACLHTVRHAWATHRLETGVNLRLIHASLGHHPRHDSARPPSDPPGAREGWRGPHPSHGGSVMVALAAICRTHGPASRATCTDQRRPSHGRAWKPSHPAGQTRVALMSRAVHTAKLTSLAISPATTAMVPPASTALPMRGGNGHRSCACRSPLSWAP